MSEKFAMADLTAGELNALVKNVGGPENARRINRGELEVGEVPPLLKRTVSGIHVLGTERFDAAKAFAEGEHADGVRIAYMNSTFRTHFLGKIEESVPEVWVAAHGLTANSRDPAILTALGGEERVELQLAHLRELMRRTQADEERSLKPGPNTCYVRGEDGTLWALGAYWNTGARDWFLFAYSVEHPLPWNRGYRVLSRDS